MINWWQNYWAQILEEVNAESSSETDKREILDQVFFLKSVLEINLCSIDLHQLLEEKSFILLCQIIKNEFDISLKAFTDSEANDFIFINTFCVIDVIKFLNITVICLSISVSVTRYDSKSDSAVTHIIVLHFQIDE